MLFTVCLCGAAPSTKEYQYTKVVIFFEIYYLLTRYNTTMVQ